jgi:uncharacterized YkwD family protein
MNHSKKIIAISRTSALLASAMGLSASAACLAGGGSYKGNTVTWNTDCASAYIQSYSGCQNGSDENCIRYGCDSFSCPASSDNTCADTGGTSSDCASIWQKIRQQLQSAELNRNDDTAKAAEETSEPVDNSASPALTSEPETAETPAAAPSSDCGSGERTRAENCAPGSCTVSDGSCIYGGTLSERFFQYLNGIFENCGLELSRCGICLPNRSAAPAAEEPQPEETDTQEGQPADETSAPSDSGNTETQPADDSAGDTTDSKIDNLSFEEQVVALVNEERAAYGLSPLTLNTELSNVARLKSQDMHDNNYFDHTSPTYGSPFQMLASFGISYRAAGENIAMGYATPEAVMEAWMNSSGHRANILNASYTQIGVGYVADGNYWTQEFIG